MTKLRLSYFDAPVSRGEECRLALFLGGLEFEDHRVKGPDWPALKPTTPFGALPTLAVPGRGTIAQSSAILAYVGRRTGMHPTDDFEAARHEAMMCHVEDLRAAIDPSMRLADPDAKKAAREELARTTIPAWAAGTEAQISSDGPFFAGTKLHVVDIKLHIVVRWLASGKLDHVPATVLAPYPRLVRLHEAVRDDARVKAWNARR